MGVVYRCSRCNLNHPHREEWDTCSACGEPTSAMSNEKPNITQAEAVSKRNHRLFERYLEAHGRT